MQHYILHTCYVVSYILYEFIYTQSFKKKTPSFVFFYISEQNDQIRTKILVTVAE